MGMFVRKNERVYFSGRISSSLFTDEFPLPAVLAVLCVSATLRDANILSILSIILNPAPKAPPTLTPAVRARSKHRFDTPKNRLRQRQPFRLRYTDND
jgi:hypothetical protein